MNLLSTMTITDIIGILTLLVSCIAIFVALYIGHRSSEDCKQIIISHKNNTDDQINEIRITSTNEIKEYRKLIHTLLASTIHNLENENKTLSFNAKKSHKKFSELLNRYEKIKDLEIKETDTINANEINNHFSEMKLLEESMIELKADYECYQSAADNINLLLTHFISLDKQLSSDI